MRSLCRLATTLLTFGCLFAACGEPPTATEHETESAGQALAAADPGRSLRVDLSRPGAEVRLDSGDRALDLRRIEVLTENGTSISADELIRVASKSAGISTPASSFVLRSRPIGPGRPTCSPRTQTDCCACGFWSTPGGVGVPPFCLALWCPCTGTGCQGTVLHAK